MLVACVAVVLLLAFAGISAVLAVGGPWNTERLAGPMPRMSAEEYQQTLTAADDSLVASMATFGPAARDGLSDVIMKASQTVKELAGTFEMLRPPAPIESAHLQLTGGLLRLSGELDSIRVAGSGSGGGICAGSAVLPDLAGSIPAAQLRSAVQALATADPAHPYTFGKFLPGLPVPPPRQLGNGTLLKRGDTQGLGQLKIVNKDTVDVIVSLTPAGTTTPHTIVYLTTGGEYTVSNIRDGNYTIFATYGTDWDAAARTFTHDCTFRKFDDPLDFKTTSREYTVWTITLGAGVSGNAGASPVSAGEFPWG